MTEPPQGIIGYAVFMAAGTKPALIVDRAAAEAYAARMQGQWWPLVCGRRTSDLPEKDQP